jgi:hypothetical protein
VTDTNALEKYIRERAVNVFTLDLHRSIDNAVVRHGVPLTMELTGLKNAFVKAVIAEHNKVIGDLAVGKFIGTYDNLIAEFPQLHVQEGGE